MANAILNFHFDFLNPSLTKTEGQPRRRNPLSLQWVCQREVQQARQENTPGSKIWIHQVYKTRIHSRTYMFSRKEGLTVPRAASLAISPTYSGNNRLLQIIDLSQGLFIQCYIFYAITNYVAKLFSSMLISATVWAWENHTDNIHSGTVIGLSFTEYT